MDVSNKHEITSNDDQLDGKELLERKGGHRKKQFEGQNSKKQERI
jgi:hypothetical protein